MLVLTPGKHHSGQLTPIVSLTAVAPTRLHSLNSNPLYSLPLFILLPTPSIGLAATPYPKILRFIDASWEPGCGGRGFGKPAARGREREKRSCQSRRAVDETSVLIRNGTSWMASKV